MSAILIDHVLLLFLIIELHFLITAVIAHIFNPASELTASTRIPTTESKAEIETNPLTTEAKTS